MFHFGLPSQRPSAAGILLSLVAILSLLVNAATAVKLLDAADPTFMIVNGTYYAASSDAGSLWVRAASTREGIANATAQKVWSDTAGRGSIWAPEITTDEGKTYIYFSAGNDAAHRMYVISAETPLGPYTTEQKLELPDDKWAIDGTMFTFDGQRYFVWSGWVGDVNIEQSLFICLMSDPVTPIGNRYIISQPRETWEQGDSPLINEGPEAIVDPNGQLHIVYSANGSWGKKYCLADLRLRKGGDPTYVWDWYKSNGCLFGSEQDRMMSGWDATLWIDGPGHHTFNLPNGDARSTPTGITYHPFVFHGVAKGTDYSWANRDWFTGSFVWWSQTTYSRSSVPGDNQNTGYSFKFFEDSL